MQPSRGTEATPRGGLLCAGVNVRASSLDRFISISVDAAARALFLICLYSGFFRRSPMQPG
jgi:hypothetical protein